MKTENRTRYVGMDVHQDSISVAIAEEGRGGEVRPPPAFRVEPIFALKRRAFGELPEPEEAGFEGGAGGPGAEAQAHAWRGEST